MKAGSELDGEILEEIERSRDEAQLEQVRLKVLGKQGSLSLALAALGRLPSEIRKEEGARLNATKQRLLAAFEERKSILQVERFDRQLTQQKCDITLPPRRGDGLIGRLHPLNQVIAEVENLLSPLGFVLAEGPDIETEDYNFTKLNIPPDHPARDMHDSFFLSEASPLGNTERLVLRTHTSPVQIRTLLSRSPPLRIMCLGRAYRRDSDPTHTPMFHQLEGLIVDKTVHLGHLKWVLQKFCEDFFEIKGLKMRFRPSFFPFTEPSMEVDIQCRRCKGEIILGEGEDWLEILGCGVVHANVLRHCKIDPEVYQGIAWGLGLDRITMLKYGIADLRNFFETDVSWLQHHGFSPLRI